MRRYRPLLLVLVAVCAVGAALRGGGDGPAAARLSAPVQAALAAGAAGDLKVWVHFTPRELTPAARSAARARAAASLSPRALARRAKAAPGAAALVDDHDLPLDAARLAACRATGARLVHRSRWLNAASFRATPGQVRALADRLLANC